MASCERASCKTMRVPISMGNALPLRLKDILEAHKFLLIQIL